MRLEPFTEYSLAFIKEGVLWNWNATMDTVIIVGDEAVSLHKVTFVSDAQVIQREPIGTKRAGWSD